jgi:hypothetical protein
MTYRIQDIIGEAIIGCRTRKPNRTGTALKATITLALVTCSFAPFSKFMMCREP